MCCRDMSQEMYCIDVLQRCIAETYQRCVLQRCGTKMCCRDVLQGCVVEMYYIIVLQKPVTQICCRCVAEMCCKYALQRCVEEMCSDLVLCPLHAACSQQHHETLHVAVEATPLPLHQQQTEAPNNRPNVAFKGVTQQHFKGRHPT